MQWRYIWFLFHAQMLFWRGFSVLGLHRDCGKLFCHLLKLNFLYRWLFRGNTLESTTHEKLPLCISQRLMHALNGRLDVLFFDRGLLLLRAKVARDFVKNLCLAENFHFLGELNLLKCWLEHHWLVHRPILTFVQARCEIFFGHIYGLRSKGRFLYWCKRFWSRALLVATLQMASRRLHIVLLKPLLWNLKMELLFFPVLLSGSRNALIVSLLKDVKALSERLVGG